MKIQSTRARAVSCLGGEAEFNSNNSVFDSDYNKGSAIAKNKYHLPVYSNKLMHEQ